ncbi:DegT/DnrJ/EryC1/StrS family aminotransferase [Flavobacterium sp. N1994]|uniref:DegT/DnrJ/EryC1/StrS family aminotransferase n=1 Tax=Flavobacterium sp. N1994 TaxID=2986827 RepID=UPI002221C388|nr:DegT/DnrJ/EryC1/StrS family aminotransferase [Flavobacterium sp. N1994]
MFVLNPDQFLLPAYRLCPFKTDYVASNSVVPEDDFAVTYFNTKFGKGNWRYTFNGREAIRLALESYELQPTDLVTIITTSQNFYISSCVTNTIEKFCRWNRELLPETKLILVNHEFGFVHQQMEKLVATGLPIIEDCCTTFFSQDSNNAIGKYGDFSTYSFTKFFPIQIGGILVNNKGISKINTSSLSSQQTQYIQNVLSNQLKNNPIQLDKRKKNYDCLLELLIPLGFTARFDNTDSTVPYVLVLNNNGVIKDLNELKIFLNNNGIQSSVFYGEDAFFIPCHQNLESLDLSYFSQVIKEIIKKVQ